MNILVAINNKEIKKKIDEKYKTNVYSYDMAFKEDVIEYIKNKSEDYIIITKLDLDGNIGYKEYIEKLHNINKNNKIIIISDKLKEEEKKYLFSNEVFNIIEGNEIDIEVIYKQIESNDKIIYKTIYKNDLSNINKRKVAVFGTSGAGKSFISYFLARSIAKYSKDKVVLNNLDIINPCLEILTNTRFINYHNNNNNCIDKYVTEDRKYNNLAYLNKDIDLKLGFQALKNINYCNLISNLEKEFDIVIFDLPTITLYTDLKEILFLVDEIIFVINPNYISLKQAKEYLEYMCIDMNINKDKIKIVINKITKNSLDKSQIKSILKKFNKYVNIKKIKQMEEYINGIIYDILFTFNEEKKLLKFLDINYNKTNKFKINKIRKVE